MSERDQQAGGSVASETVLKAAAKAHEGSGAAYVDAAFARAETEDDDGYDPWSDRPARREPLFVEDPWR